MTIADRGLRHLLNERLGIAQHEHAQADLAIEFLLEDGAWQTVGEPTP
jgi:hypothetical protein